MKSRRMGWAGHIVYKAKIRNAYRILVVGKRQSRIPRLRWQIIFMEIV
jgi:hypothetical protein